MLEKAPKTFNARFESEVQFAIADLIAAKYGRDKTEAVSRAILEARERITGEAVPDGYSAVPGQVARGVVAPIESSEPKAAEAPFHPMCQHCGGNFGAWNRFASICLECKSAGHAGDRRECSCCGDAGTGAL